jgi:hypothetical protein
MFLTFFDMINFKDPVVVYLEVFISLKSLPLFYCEYAVPFFDGLHISFQFFIFPKHVQ